MTSDWVKEMEQAEPERHTAGCKGCGSSRKVQPGSEICSHCEYVLRCVPQVLEGLGYPLLGGFVQGIVDERLPTPTPDLNDDDSPRRSRPRRGRKAAS